MLLWYRTHTPVVNGDLLIMPVATHDLDKVFEAVRDLIEWKELGLQLGVLNPTLEKICQQQHYIIDQCKMSMLSAWLQQQDNVPQKGIPTWLVLQAALRRIGKNELANRIVVSCEYIIVMVCAVNMLSLT